MLATISSRLMAIKAESGGSFLVDMLLMSHAATSSNASSFA
jgi:hypothetical protein